MSLGVQAAQAAWARALLEGLREGGVEALVLSPGSRSTPFALAAHALEFSIHVAIDERAAAFFALGRARLMARPSLLLCTSGSAPAHYLPALVEASMARIPLIALTADRPPELHHCGANQSVDQRGLFGSFVRASAELGPPRSGESLRLAMGRIGAWAVARSLHPEPGPVHLNAPAIEPLEPPLTPPASPPPGAADASTHRTTRVALPRMRPDPVALAALVRAARASRSGWLVVGPLGPQRA
ncbi:MAG: thiamine pyrophosphate-binding protein, partial [Myxococcales bacterium]|nr:thiamine pyrophosphate-binding protein [Myxococcales bacterium]